MCRDKCLTNVSRDGTLAESRYSSYEVMHLVIRDVNCGACTHRRKGHTWRVLWDFRHMHTQDLFHARPWLLPRDGAGFVSVPTVHAPLGVAARLPKPLSEHRVDSDAHLCSSGPRAGLPIHNDRFWWQGGGRAGFPACLIDWYGTRPPGDPLVVRAQNRSNFHNT